MTHPFQDKVLSHKFALSQFLKHQDAHCTRFYYAIYYHIHDLFDF